MPNIAASGDLPPALALRSVDVCVGSLPIVHGADLTIRPGELHVLFGPNGSGKSSLLKAVMGLDPFRVTAGEIALRGELVDELPVDERARRGLGMAFQVPPSLEGVRVATLGGALGASDALHDAAALLDLAAFEEREINVGFSGGEIKRWEVCKLFLQDPSVLLFDEPESGVDIEHVAAVADAIRTLLATPGRDGSVRSALVVSHTGSVLKRLSADVGHLLVDGRIVHSGDPNELFDHIEQHGYSAPRPVAVS